VDLFSSPQQLVREFRTPRGDAIDVTLILIV